MLTPTRARGPTTDTRIPVIAKSNVPTSLRARQPFALLVSAGMFSSGQTIDSSSRVRVIEKTGARVAQAGRSSEGPRRQTATWSGTPATRTRTGPEAGSREEPARATWGGSEAQRH